MKRVPRCPWLAAVFCQQNLTWQLGAGVLWQWCVVGWLIVTYHTEILQNKIMQTGVELQTFNVHTFVTHLANVFSLTPNVWLDIFRVQLTELCSVTSQICTNGVACSSVKPSQLDLAPVPLSIFRSNSKFDENSERSSFEYTRPITTIFCTRHDSDIVVTCAKYRCDRWYTFYNRVFWIFIEFRIRSKYA